LILFALFSLISASYAEYRVYQYYVFSKTLNLNSPPPTLVTTTLDPKSYVAYHGGRDSIEVNLLRSWMCLGNTNHQDFCLISEGKELNEGNIE